MDPKDDNRGTYPRRMSKATLIAGVEGWPTTNKEGSGLLVTPPQT